MFGVFFLPFYLKECYFACTYYDLLYFIILLASPGFYFFFVGEKLIKNKNMK